MQTNSIEPLHFAGMPEAYPYLRDLILSEGLETAPRGEPTIEILGASFRIEDAVRRGVPVGTGRKVGVKMMAIDGTCNLAGVNYPDVSIAVAPILGRFADYLVATKHLTTTIMDTSNAGIGGPFFQGSYGPRIGKQLEAVEQQLRADKDTRQALVSLWREEDRNPFWKDRPCTTEFQLMIRDGKLEMFVFMRANDLWTGTCYDVFQFGQIQAAMAHVLGIPSGAYHHYATSLHIYERDVEKFAAVEPWYSEEHLGATMSWPAVTNNRESFGPDWDLLEPGEYTCWQEVRDRFTAMLNECRLQLNHSEIGMFPPPFEPRNPVEAWYYNIMSNPTKKESDSK